MQTHGCLEAHHNQHIVPRIWVFNRPLAPRKKAKECEREKRHGQARKEGQEQRHTYDDMSDMSGRQDVVHLPADLRPNARNNHRR